MRHNSSTTASPSNSERRVEVAVAGTCSAASAGLLRGGRAAFLRGGHAGFLRGGHAGLPAWAPPPCR